MHALTFSLQLVCMSSSFQKPENVRADVYTSLSVVYFKYSMQEPLKLGEIAAGNEVLGLVTIS